MLKDYNRVSYSRLGSGLPQLLLAGSLIERNAGNPITRRPEYFLLHFVSEGSGRVGRLVEKKVRIKAGSWFICFPGQEIQYEGEPEDPWRYHWVGFRGGETRQLLEAGGMTENQLILVDSDPTKAEEIILAIRDSLERRDWGGEIEGGKKLLELLEHLTQNEKQPSKCSLPIRNDSAEEINRAIQFMVTNLSSGIRIEEVIDHVGLERSYFSKIFSQKVGHSMRDHLAELRMGQAEALLRNGQLNIESVARAVGFEDIRPLLRLFKKKYGTTPRRQQALWRKEKG